MSINDIADEMGSIARAAVLEAKAVVPCPIHSDVLINQGEPDADRHAYALATIRGKAAGLEEWRTELMEAVESELVWAAEDECPSCGAHRND